MGSSQDESGFYLFVRSIEGELRTLQTEHQIEEIISLVDDQSWILNKAQHLLKTSVKPPILLLIPGGKK